jgi:hypothetical protein
MDGSAKMWTLIRGVELNSFKAFDDRLSNAQQTLDGIFAAMTNEFIMLSFRTHQSITITEYPALILGFILEPRIIVTTKTISSISTYRMSLSNSSIDELNTIKITDSCSSFFVDNNALLFWYGLRDGKIIRFAAESSEFQVMVLSRRVQT